jgi:hypothetical protein
MTQRQERLSTSAEKRKVRGMKSNEYLAPSVEHMSYPVSFAITSVCYQKVFRLNIKTPKVFPDLGTSYIKRITLQG